MGVKKTFTATAKHTIYYQYRCCHCGKDSGVNTYEFVENKSQTKHGTFIDPKLSPAEEEELHASAKKALIERIEKERTDVSNGNYNSVVFKGKCPHCKKHQPWAGGTYMDSVLKVSLAWHILVLTSAIRDKSNSRSFLNWLFNSSGGFVSYPICLPRLSVVPN